MTRFTDIQLATDLILGKCGEDCWGAAGILAAYDLLRRAAVSNLSVCLIGETGSGKEVFARNLHRESAREGKLIATNCAAIPEHMADGELFGYRRGAFTGAERANPGHFRAAHGGTLFLDEVSDLPAQVQIKLLRAIEEKAVIPLGQSNPEPADARIVCAAQLALHEYVEGGSFRSDLYSRLNGVEICIPPLRMRREEILGHFMRHLQGTNGTVALAPDFVEQICLYDWPLNVREVVQVAERTKVLHGDVKELGIQHLPERIATFNRGERKRAVHPPVTAEPGVNAGGDHLSPRDRLARDLANALREARGNVSVAAKNLGVSRSMAYRLMKRLPSLDPEEIRVDKFRN